MMRSTELTIKGELGKGRGQCEDNCNTLLFSDLVGKFDLIERSRSGKADKLDVIFTKQLKELVQDQSIFPLVRLLIPLYDTERRRYGLKQATVAKTYVDALQLNRSSNDAQRLVHWKDQSKAQSLAASAGATGGGDFCSILEDVLRSRVREGSSTATLQDVNSMLDALTDAYGETGKAVFIREQVLTKFNAREQKWLMRIIFQDLKIGLKLESVLGFLSPWASQCFAECSNLRMICEGGRGNHRPKGLNPHSAFTPMLAKGFPNTNQLIEVERAMNGSPFVMDVKLDGERMLCHADRSRGCKLLTRNGNDYTQKYRRLADDAVNIMKSCHSYILDGEVCAYDSGTGRFVAFGSNRSVGNMENALASNNDVEPAVLGKTDESSVEQPCSSLRLVYIVFDVIFAEGDGVDESLNRILLENSRKGIEVISKGDMHGSVLSTGLPSLGGELTHLPLFARRSFLEERLTVIPDRVILMQHKLVLSCDIIERQREIESYFNDMMNRGEEGLVVKSWLSTYELGEKSRSKNASWIKMKPEYSNNMTDLDLIILGGYFGEGKGVRADGVSHFLLGVRDDNNSTESDVKYLTVGKIGTGYTFSELEELRAKLNPYWQQWPNYGRLPDHFSPWKIGKSDDIPHVWILPERSCIIETKCAEITSSTNFAIGLTCRFPRARRIRYDKEISGVMTSTEFINARNRKRIMVENVDEADTETTGILKPQIKKKKKVPEAGVTATRGRLKSENGASYIVNVTEMPNSGKIFEGMLFCVLENTFYVPDNFSPFFSPRSFTALGFVDFIRLHGGVVVANPIENEDGKCIIICGNKRTVSIQNNIASKRFDSIDFCYILESVIAGKLLPVKPRHYIGMSTDTSSRVLRDIDIFGDSFTEEINDADLQQLYIDMDYAVDNFEGLQEQKIYKSAPVALMRIKQNEAYGDMKNAYSEMKKNSNWIYIVKDIKCDFDREQLHLDLVSRTKRYLFAQNDIVVHIARKSTPAIVGSVLWHAEQRLRAYGAILNANLTTDVTHVIVDAANSIEVENVKVHIEYHILSDKNTDSIYAADVKCQVRELRFSTAYKFEKEIVDLTWINKCISTGLIVPAFITKS